MPRSCFEALLRRFAGPCTLAAAATCGSPERGAGRTPRAEPPPPAAAAPRVEVDIFAFGRTLGAVAPCGCTAEPLGGIDYAFGIVDGEDVAPHRIVMAAGSLLYPDPAGPEAPTDPAAWAQAQARARAIARRFEASGPRLAVGLGPFDRPVGENAPKGPSYRDLPPRRTLANAGPELARLVEPHVLIPVSQHGRTVRIGVTSVLDPGLPHAGIGGPPTDPVAALKKAASDMRTAGAEVTVAILHAAPSKAVKWLAEAPGAVDLAVVAVAEGPSAERLGAPARRVGGTIVAFPGERLQTIAQIRLSFAPDAKLDGAAIWKLLPGRETLQEERKRLAERIARFEGRADADPAYLERLRSELSGIEARLEGRGPEAAPATVEVRRRKVTCHGASDPAAAALLAEYDAFVREENRKRFAGVRPAPPGKGEPGYVGVEECSACHDEAAEHWEGTRHAHAYATLVELGKQYDVACVGCHVTGFRKPGGSEVVENEGLRNVQCEVCHGPGSLHAEEPEREGRPFAIRRAVPDTVCKTCHTPEHSDTFDYVAYLRDILGPGHGAQARAALGDGPTGAELRRAALEKAGGACKKKKQAMVPAAPTEKEPAHGPP